MRLLRLAQCCLLSWACGSAAAQVLPTGWPAGTAACAGCHLPHAPPAPRTPRLAGLPGDYLVKQLRDLRDGERPADKNLQLAHALDRETARRLAQVLAAEPVPTWPRSASVEGRRLYEQGDQAVGRPACQVCHGNATGLAPGMSAPPLQGQPRSYLVAQLRAWRELGRRNSPEDLMNDAARGLSDAQIEALAQHLGSP